MRHGICANLVVGDFDTLNAVLQRPNVILLNTEKDDIDMLAATREGVNTGYLDFHLCCGTGGRIDHTLIIVFSREAKEKYNNEKSIDDCRI